MTLFLDVVDRTDTLVYRPTSVLLGVPLRSVSDLLVTPLTIKSTINHVFQTVVRMDVIVLSNFPINYSNTYSRIPLKVNITTFTVDQRISTDTKLVLSLFKFFLY